MAYIFFMEVFPMTKKKKDENQDIARKTQKAFLSPADPLGSYTGNPENPHEKPQQDADDL